VDNALSVVIVGAGVAGANAALELRRLATDAHITLVGSEAHLPYQRPPLSKEFLRGTEQFEDMLVAPRSEYERLGIDLVLGRRVVKLEPEYKRIRLESDEVIRYDRVLIATGGRKRHLPFAGADREGVFDLRTLEDAERIQAAARAGRRVVVIGLGFVGCEVSASLRTLGLEVTAIDPAQAPLVRVLGPEVAGVIAELHRSRGVELVLGDGVDRLEGGERVERVVTKSGRQFECDFVVAGIGIDPEVDLLTAAGARISNGVEVDEYCRTSLPDIYAAGDIADHAHRLFGRIRVEHFNNAEKQGRAAAASLLDRGVPYDYVHSFWSEQFDHTLEYVGFAEEWDGISIEGSLQDRDFIVRYLRGGELLAAAAMGRGGDPERDEPGELKNIAIDIHAGHVPDPHVADGAQPTASQGAVRQ
jgi:3-phenylpropionate/trans-cinnamate dioxygenase ferredoxin reductase subunit